MQYRALRHARINGHDYAPGEGIQDSGAIRNVRTLVAARYIEPAGPDPESESDTDQVTDAMPRWKRDDLDDLATRAGVEAPDTLQNKDAVIAAIHDAVDDETLAALMSGDLGWVARETTDDDRGSEDDTDDSDTDDAGDDAA